MLDPESKIYVVVFVFSLIIIGIALFLFYLEYRLRKSEKRLKNIEVKQKRSNNHDGRKSEVESLSKIIDR
jgi:hypothetical protein